jgi:hypothetical protein
LPSAAEYQAAIQKLDWDGLQNLWERIETRSTAPDWAAGKAFEYLVLRAFELDGAGRIDTIATARGATIRPRLQRLWND